MVIGAEQHASRLVVAASQRMPASRWSSHKDVAAMALRKLADPHVPASLTTLEQAVKRANSGYEKAETAQREAQRSNTPTAEAVDAEPGEDRADAA